MGKFSNSKKNAHLSKLPIISLEDCSCNLVKRCKFNFSFLTTGENAGQRFEDWSDKQQVDLFNKLTHYSREPLSHWRNECIGTGRNRFRVLSIYPHFPQKSDFIHPKHVPHDVAWGRFRLDWSTRLAGFVIPKELHGKFHCDFGVAFDANTFYVVFLDKDHQFAK